MIRCPKCGLRHAELVNEYEDRWYCPDCGETWEEGTDE